MTRTSTSQRGLAAAAVVAALAATFAGGSCGHASVRDDRPPSVLLVPAFGGETFPSAVDLLQHPTDDQRWYVVEQGGVVETFLESDPAGTRTVAIALTGLITTGESGLLGMAFHPDFATTGELFLSYVAASAAPFGTSTVARYVSTDGGLTFALDPGPTPIVLTLDQPFANHNGGDLDFGPDGMLYVAFGDGGGAGDPNGNAQNTGNWFGKILRLDVDAARPYAIPVDNPFVGVAGLDEIWAYGLRNPWRMRFDPVGGALWVGDVGQANAEEIDVVVRGGNYGWNLEEGDRAYPSGAPSALPGMVAPRAVHYHPQCSSITGGVVCHGTALPQLQGQYLYGDFVTGRIFALPTSGMNAMPVQIHQAALNLSSFGQARGGDVYVVAYGGAQPIQKIVPTP